jgi:carbon-monoxide dehydrogenase large subunit
MDALAPLGVKDVAMPATAQNVWRAIHDANGR